MSIRERNSTNKNIANSRSRCSPEEQRSWAYTLHHPCRPQRWVSGEPAGRLANSRQQAPRFALDEAMSTGTALQRVVGTDNTASHLQQSRSPSCIGIRPEALAGFLVYNRTVPFDG